MLVESAVLRGRRLQRKVRRAVGDHQQERSLAACVLRDVAAGVVGLRKSVIPFPHVHLGAIVKEVGRAVVVVAAFKALPVVKAELVVAGDAGAAPAVMTIGAAV